MTYQEHDCNGGANCHYEGSMFCMYCGLTEEDNIVCTPDCDGCCASDTKPCHRGGCDMCDPYDFLAYEQEMYSREAEEMSLGRPLFPNEY